MLRNDNRKGTVKCEFATMALVSSIGKKLFEAALIKLCKGQLPFVTNGLIANPAYLSISTSFAQPGSAAFDELTRQLQLSEAILSLY